MFKSRLLFGLVVFLAAFLLFLVEPIAAKQLLPVFGGSSAVWITCLVFFQTALLCAYLYAHWLTRHPRWLVQIVLLLAAAVAVVVWRAEAFGGASSFTLLGGHPALAIVVLLTISIGLPFLALGATSPLLQVWLSQVETGRVPYRLYALSNLASLLALGLYPAVIEPNFTLKSQWFGWGCGFVFFALLSAGLTWQSRASMLAPLVGEDMAGARTPVVHKPLWILLPMAASMQLSSVTAHLTQNVAAIPLLWILPLAVYLITLIVAFQFPRLVPRALMTRVLVLMLASLGYMLAQVEGSWPLKMTIGFFLLELFVAALFCHSEAVQLRPERASEATVFYLYFAAGGALGAFLIGIVSPLVFSFNYDLALSFFATAALALVVVWPRGWGQRALWATTSVLMLLLVFFLRTAFHRDTQVAVRNFYGSLRVRQTIGFPPAIVRVLSNGTIQHGSQIFSAELIHTPTTYYAEDSGIGIALRNCCGGVSGQGKPGEDRPGAGRARKIGVIGLGVGTIAAYGRAGDEMTFYEINPAVIPIAREVFAYIRNSPARITILEGDARTTLARQAPQQFDVLVVDAFSGDAIPLHLLTTEAMRIYQRHLAPGGILAFHISNQHVDLNPEISLLAQSVGMRAMRFSSATNEQVGEFSATWMLATRDLEFFQQPEVSMDAKPPEVDRGLRVWTDDYSSLLPVLHW